MITSCPECGSYSVHPTGRPDDDGHVEYRCTDCGYYFVGIATVRLQMASGCIYANLICANCEFFDWTENTGDDAGACSRLGHEVNGGDVACPEFFVFNPPCLRRQTGKDE